MSLGEGESEPLSDSVGRTPMHCLPVEDIFASVHPPTGAEKKATAPATSNTHSDQQQPAQHLYPPQLFAGTWGFYLAIYPCLEQIWKSFVSEFG